MTRTKQLGAFLMALVLVGSVFAGSIGVVSAQSSVSISQTAQGSTTVEPGDTVTVDVTVETTESGSPAIELENVPSGWTIQATDNDGGSFQSTNYEWFWLGDSDLDGSYNHTVTYEVTVPGGVSDGDYTIDAVGSSQGSAGVDDDYEDADPLTITVETPDQNQDPTASFTASPGSPEAGETVNFDASASSDDSAITSYSWDFGDGNTATGVSPTHTFGSAGTYTVELTVTDDDGADDSTTQQVTVTEPVTSSVSVDQSPQGDTTLAPGATLAVDVSIDTTASGAPAIELEGVPSSWTIQATDNDSGSFQSTNYEWFWSQDSDLDGDYSHTVTYEVTVPGSASDGTYQIDAVGSSQGSGGVDDDYEATDTLSISIQAPQNQPPTASFTANETSVNAGDTVGFDASASGDGDGSIQSYDWDFGDGDSDAGATTTHTYDTAGTYTVTLTVTDDDGDTDSTTETITVSEPPAAGPGAADVSITAGAGTEGSAYNNGAWVVENTGDQEITSIQFDLSTTAMPDVVFDPEGSAGDQAAKGLEIDDQTGDGVGVVSTADADVFSQPHNGVDGDDGYDVMTVEFTDFEPGEEFVFSVDNDPTIIKGATLPSQESGPISGLEMSRGTVTVGYADDTTQTTQLFGDGSAGGSQATLDDSIASAPSIDVQGVGLDSTILDPYHSGATVSEAAQTVTITGEPGATATLLHFEAERDLDYVPDYDGTPGYDVEPYEPSKVEQIGAYETVTLDGSGEATIDVTLLNSTEVGGYNYFVATHGEPGSDTGMVSNAVVLKLVDNEPPQAAVTASPDTLEAGETVTFDASGSNDADGTIASYAWDFDGDGSTDQVTAIPSVTHTYAATGIYTAEVVVTDDDGATDSATQQVTVEEPNQAPTAAFSVSPSDPEVGETVTLDAGPSTDSDGTIQSYEWIIATPDGQATLLDTDFESGSLSAAGWSHDAIESSASAGVDSATSNSGSQSAFHNGGEGAIVSPAVDGSGTDSFTVEYWIRKGDDSFSENPDAGAGEDMIVEYLDVDGDWIEIDRIEDSVADGAEVSESVTVMDAGALHDGLQIRFRQESASAANVDVWHVDDVSIVAHGSATVTKTGETVTHTFATSGDHGVTLVVTDDDGAKATDLGSVTVQATDTGPGQVGDFENPPTDPDGDGVYEDVNGDGEVNVLDAQAIFANTDDPVVQNNLAAFDFNDDGDVNVLDAQAIFANGVGV